MQRSILAILSLAFCAGAQAVSEDVQLNLVTTQWRRSDHRQRQNHRNRPRTRVRPHSAGATAG